MNPLGRRSIRLKEYDYRSDGAYFVTMCIDGRLPVISEARKKLLKHELLNLERRFIGVRVDFYVFMQNHIHLIFFLHKAEAALSSVVQVFKSRTTLVMKRSGYTRPKFWQRNYYERVVRDDNELNALREYIRMNPELEVINFEELTKRKGRASSTPTTQ